MLNRRQMLFGSGAAVLGTAGVFNAGALLAQEIQPPPQPASPFPLVLDPNTNYRHPNLASSSTEPVGIAIVCAIDISGSINSISGEYRSQIEALGEAIASDDFRQSIFMPGGPGSAAICVIDYDGKSKLQIPWVDLREDNREKFVALGTEIASLERRASGGTTHEAALQNAALCFNNLSPWEAENKSVNIMTDGTSSSAGLATWRRILANDYNATIYALVTEGNNSSTLNPWAERNLITPPNTYFKPNGRPLPAGFVHTVATERQTQSLPTTTPNPGTAAFQGQVRLALRRQVILQTAGLDVETYTRFASLEELDSKENPYDFLQNDRRFAALDTLNHSSPIIQI